MSSNLNKYQSKNILKRVVVRNFKNCLLDKVHEVLNDSSLQDKGEVSVCDVGCGEGIIDRSLADNFSTLKITGYDLSEEAISYARSFNPSGKYFVRNVFEEKGDDTFSLVLCTEVLEHLSEPEKALDILIKITENALIITVPWEPYFCLGNFLTGNHITRWGNHPEHVNKWTRKSFKEWLSKNTGGG